MPDVEGSLARMNQQFARPNIDDVDPSLFDGSQSLADICVAIGLAPTEVEGQFLDILPAEMGASLVAFIHANLLRDERLPITFMWSPAYDWETRFQYGGPCGHLVHLRIRDRAALQ